MNWLQIRNNFMEMLLQKSARAGWLFYYLSGLKTSGLLALRRPQTGKESGRFCKLIFSTTSFGFVIRTSNVNEKKMSDINLKTFLKKSSTPREWPQMRAKVCVCESERWRKRASAKACICKSVRHRKRVLGVAKHPREISSAHPRRQNSCFFGKMTKS